MRAAEGKKDSSQLVVAKNVMIFHQSKYNKCLAQSLSTGQ